MQENDAGSGQTTQVVAWVRVGNACLLRYPPRTLKSWDFDVQESIFRYLSVGVPERLSKVRLIWNLFDNGSPLGKAILEKLNDVVDHYTEGRGLPFHNVTTIAEEEVVEAWWRVVRGTLESMVVAIVQREAVDEIKRTLSNGGESDLGFFVVCTFCFRL